MLWVTAKGLLQAKPPGPHAARLLTTRRMAGAEGTAFHQVPLKASAEIIVLERLSSVWQHLFLPLISKLKKEKHTENPWILSSRELSGLVGEYVSFMDGK